jgi:hypothetical protein
MLKKLSKNRLILYSIIFILMIIGNIYYFRKNFSDNKISVPTLNPLLQDALLAENNNIVGINNNLVKQPLILENQLFRELKKVGDWPVVPQKIGRANPFLPFFE